MKPLTPVLVAELFPELRRDLLTLLEGLRTDEWELPTAAPKWSVKDVALHLLGGDIGILSRRRDCFHSGKMVSSPSELVSMINQLNEAWVAATRRMSPQVLRDLLSHAGKQADAYLMSLDPLGEGEPVSWAGPEPAPRWFDVAREYTERWHHQQQIRDATGRPGLYEARIFGPVLDTFVRALPYTFRDVPAQDGTALQITLSGAGGGEWVLRRGASKWELLAGSYANCDAGVRIPAERAWMIFTKGLRGTEAARSAELDGDRELAAKVLETVSVIA
jgi:uncharacterized protein (TIGR03083 family)